MVPLFNADGNLPKGVHLATWSEFCDRFGFTPHRRRLLGGMKRAMDSLRAAGCKTFYIGGSFVTSKEIPDDYDGCWSTQEVDFNLLDPVLLDFSANRLAQKIKYGGELFLTHQIEGNSRKTFLEFFSIDKDTGKPKGLVMLNL